MATIKNTPRYLNTDSDERVLQTTEMSDALNIRITAEDNGDAGVVKNVDGNTSLGALGNTTTGSTNKIVGTYEHEGTNRFFVFVYNSLGINTVYELEQSSNSFVKIIESANILLSGEPLHIDGMVINGDLFLYFTDGVEEPQKINVDTSLVVGTYPSSTTESAVMKVSPLSPTVTFQTDSSISTNNIKGKSFQFALQYVYADGEVSAIGQYSGNLCAANTLSESISDTKTEDNNSNSIKIQQTSIIGIGASLVPNIRVYFRDVYDNTMFRIGEFTYSELVTGINFYNDGVYTQVSDNDYNKLQDLVPKKAKAQTISSNRLFYGNYTEGFDKATVSSTLAANYSDETIGETMPISVTSGASTEIILSTTNISSLVGTGEDVNVIVDYTLGDTSLGYYIVSTSTAPSFNIKDETNTVAATVTSNPQFRVIKGTSISASIIVKNPSTIADFKTKMAAQLDGLQFTIGIPSSSLIDYHTDWAFKWEGFAVIEITAVVDTNGVSIENDIIAYKLNSSEVRERTGGGSTPSDYTVADGYSASVSESGATTVSGFDYGANNTIAYLANISNKTFKANESHSIGVVFEDQLGRTTGVYELDSIEIEGIGSRAAGSKGSASIDSTLTVSNLDPSLSKFFYVYGGGSSIDSYLQFGVSEAVTAVSDNVKEQFSEDSIFVALRSIEGNGQSINSRGGDLNTGFSKGDKLRILSHGETSKTYPDEYVFDVSGVYTNNESGALSSDNDFQGTGSFLVLENANHEGFGVAYVGTDDNLWEDNVLVEVFTPKKENETKIYRALSQKYNVSDIGSTTQTLTEGNAWYKRRQIQFKSGGNRLINSYAFVESQQYSDLDKSTIGDLGGKPYAVLNSEVEQNRISSITYSEPQLADNAQNNLSSFNASLANFADYEMNYGGIYGLVDMSDSIMILQSDKVSRVPLSRQILATGTGSELVTQSTDILGLQQHYSGNFGINENRTAFLNDDGTVYLVDVTRSKIVAITQQGVKVLNDLGVDSWINERTSSMLEDANGYFVSVGVDKDNDEVYFSLQNLPLTSYSESIVYSKQLDKFTSKSSVAAPYFGTLGLRFFSFRDDDAWEQNTNNTKGNFYGNQEDAYFKVSFNQSPSLNKVFHALSIEGTADADVEITTSNNQNLTIPQESFKLREGEYYTKVGRSDSDFNKIVVGKVASINGDNVTFQNRVNRIPFKLGGDAFVQSGSTYTSVAGTSVSGVVDAYTLSFVNASNLSLDTIVAISGEGVIDGEPMRGSYSTAKFTFDDVKDIEVFAVNASVAESNLHNNDASQ
jgi:hypothetical protein